MTRPLAAAILFSGTGSNLVAIAEAVRAGRLPLSLVLALSDRPEARGLARAAEFGIPTRTLATAEFADRASHEAAISRAIDESGAELVVLAGYLRIFEAPFVARYAGRMINLHPSLLPAYRGLHTHRRALEAGEAVHGTSIHFVTCELDGGPLIAQAELGVRADDSEASLGARVRALEHRLYPEVLGWYARGWLTLEGSTVHLHGVPLARPVVCRYAEHAP